MFNWIVQYSLRNRLFVLAFAALLMVYGAMTAWRTPVDVFPDLNKPLVTVLTENGKALELVGFECPRFHRPVVTLVRVELRRWEREFNHAATANCCSAYFLWDSTCK